MVTASPDYVIDMLTDQPPSVSFLKPGRDTRVTSVEEVFTEVEARDDYGVRRLELIYSVNGAPESTLVLQSGGQRSLRNATGTHTFFLEEWSLEPGDFVSYYARATDGLIALRAGYPSACLGSVTEYKAPANYHWRTDTPEKKASMP